MLYMISEQSFDNFFVPWMLFEQRITSWDTIRES